MIPSDCRGVCCVLLMYDVGCAASFAKCESLFDEISEASVYSPIPPILLVGHKADVWNSRAVSVEQGQGEASRLNLLGFIEALAKDGVNVEQAVATVTGAYLCRAVMEPAPTIPVPTYTARRCVLL